MKELEPHDDKEGMLHGQDMSRRHLLLLSLSGMGALVLGCGGSGSGSTGSSGGSTSGTALEGEIGPYFADDSASGFLRSNILTNLDGSETQTGIPLTLNLTIVDAEKSDAPMSGCQVDIWHCNASGIYSDEASEGTSSETWLRGYQVSDSSGKVSFVTIFPGWYQGRVTHIHLRVRSKYNNASSTSDGTNTTQVFFPQSTVNYINTNVAPYNSHGTNSTTNSNDRVYEDQTKSENELVLSGDFTAGFSASFTIKLPITIV